MKRVRVTIEVDESFVRMAKATIELTPKLYEAARGAPEPRALTALDALGVAVYVEARGGLEQQVDAAIPEEWADHLRILHEAREVIEE